MAASTANLIAQGSLTTLLSTELNSLASGSYSSLGSAFNNVFATANFNGYFLADVMLNLAAYTGTPTAGSYIGVWFIPAIDGTNYDAGGSTIAVGADVIIPVDALASGPYQRTMRNIWLPCGQFKTLAQNNGTGIALAASGNTIKVRPVSLQTQ
jgi:hypothetical protein